MFLFAESNYFSCQLRLTSMTFPAYLKFALLCLLKWLQIYIMDPILWLLTSRTTRFGRVQKSKQLWQEFHLNDGDYETCAQLVKIWFKATYCSSVGSNLSNFFYTHVSYLHPKAVFKTPQLSLLTVSSTHFVFVNTRPSTDIYNLDK